MTASVSHPERLVAEYAADASATPFLPPTPDLRAWLAALEDPAAAADDELPEIILPARVVHRLPRGRPLGVLLNPDHIDLALSSERDAASRGLTLEVAVLQAAVSRAADA